MPAPTLAQIVASLVDSGFAWAPGRVTYSIPTGNSLWPGYAPDDEQANSSFSVLTSAQAAQFRIAVEAWDALVALQLDETDDIAATGQIRIAFTDVSAFTSDEADAYAYSAPAVGSASPPTWSGDVWLDHDSLASATFAVGGYSFAVIIHELGHALGLKHPFEDGETLPEEYDNLRYTVMAYETYDDFYFVRVEERTSGAVLIGSGVGPTGPMVFDIAALQSIYGNDTATGAGDTTYTWSESTPFMRAVYDAGGIDTFDLSAHTRGSIVDLTPGAYSSIAYYSVAAQLAYWQARYPGNETVLQAGFGSGDTYTWSDNLGIAFSTTIENVIGSGGGDTVRGNTAANNIAGRLGDDSIDGGAGDDYLRGDEGADRIVGGAGFDDINGNMGNDTASGGLGTDWVVGGKDNDNLAGEEGDDIVYGNLGADTCDGGVGDDLVRGGQGDDSLTGGAGADWLSGDRDNDTMSGGAGADIFHSFGEAGFDRVLDFNRAEGDRVQLDPGTVYTFAQAGADVIVSMNGGGQLILVGVSMASLTGDWIFGS